LIIFPSWNALQGLQGLALLPITFKLELISQNPSFDEAPGGGRQEATVDLSIHYADLRI
jgi:hypothetical protein